MARVHLVEFSRGAFWPPIPYPSVMNRDELRVIRRASSSSCLILLLLDGSAAAPAASTSPQNWFQKGMMKGSIAIEKNISREGSRAGKKE